MIQGWPDSFDFQTDEICRDVFRPFINECLKKLEDFDKRRPAHTQYIFSQHSLRVATDIHKTCLHLGLGQRVASNMYWATLPHDAGKVKLPVDIWDQINKPDAAMKHLRRSHTVMGVEMVRDSLGHHDHPFLTLMTDIMRDHHEHMDGTGYQGKKAEDLSLPVRLVAIVEAFDGDSIYRPHFKDRDLSPAAVIERMKAEDAGCYDPDLLEAFAEIKLRAASPGFSHQP